MVSPLNQAGAVQEPSEYATLSMDRAITGLWTQRSPLRDADVPYLYGKFYSASRFDSLIDGINREINARLTNERRRGSSQYNTNTFPAINSFYAYKRMVAGAQVNRVIVDGQDGKIYDATAGQKSTIFTKSGGAGKARFQGVNTSLFFTDGVENKKWLQPGPWQANTQYQVGNSVIDTNGNIQYLQKIIPGEVNSSIGGTIAISGKILTMVFQTGIHIGAFPFTITPGMSLVLGDTGGFAHTFLNGLRVFVLSVNGFAVTAFIDHPDLASVSDTGNVSTNDIGTPATSGATIAWNPAIGGTSFDGFAGSQMLWVNYGPPVFDWQVGPPTVAPVPSFVANGSAMGYWSPSGAFSSGALILAPNGSVWATGGAGVSGAQIPSFTPSITVQSVQDNTLTWNFCPWLGSTGSALITAGPIPWSAAVTAFRTGANGVVLVDSNGNLQKAIAGAGPTGGAAPTWNTTYGGNTTDNGLTWANQGPYLALAFAGWEWGYAYHSIDGSVTSLSPVSAETGPIIDGAAIAGNYSSSPQVDSVWIFRIASGQSTLVFLASIPNNQAGTTWSFVDQNPDGNLLPQQPAPIALSNNPPPVGMTAPVYHSGRIWAIYKNAVVYSGGPSTLTGNGNTSFPPLNSFPITEQPIRLFSGVTNQGAALFVWGTSNVWVILGDGSPGNPFRPPVIYMGDVGITNYDAVTMVGSTAYAMTAKGKAVSLDPGAGYTEFGFPIGDQFAKVTTGGISSALYSPSSTFVSWAELGSGDTAVYVADGAVGWFRFSPVASPESGYLWSPRAAIVGGTSAVQAVETSPGITQLLIAPASSGPILFRDSAVNADWSGGAYVAYPSYDTKGNIVLCQSGEVAEIAHIALKSIAVGARPIVSLLLGEIAASTTAPFDPLSITSTDPPNLPPSVTLYSDRYSALQNGVTPKCDNFQLKIDYGTQNVPDELLTFSVYGAKHSERRQQ